MTSMPTAEAPQILASVRPTIAIVGRPNVGKSTLFNRITGTRQAITDGQPGITRDRIYGLAEWAGRRFTLVDTGGMVPRSVDEIETEVHAQAEIAVRDADLVVMLCDATEGLTGLDQEVGDMLRKRNQPCVLVLNKVDHPDSTRYDTSEFYRLGLGEPLTVSAATGRRSGDLLDAIVARFDKLGLGDGDEIREDEIRIVIAGRPNVGKSTLMNRLAGQSVSIVHDSPGTTRDATDIRIERNGRRYVLVDTAGQRRRSKINESVEYFSVLRASRNIERSHVVILLLDATEGVTVQDARIMNHVIDSGKAMLVAVNKWDLKSDRSADPDAPKADIEEYTRDMLHCFPFLRDFPWLFLSALTGRRASRCLDLAANVHAAATQRISTSELNRWVEGVTQRVDPSAGGKEVRLLYLTQVETAPPTFLVFCNRPDLVSNAYRRYVENELRKSFEFGGTPVRLVWRSTRSRQARKLGE
ncbi:MAG: ribosome biogenesis GTPase Der [Candidatus Latescibacterota bacterium]|nr:ribosome biogenesis GTPase Der [Candidatus Latescibacterota bacterium]